MDSIGLFEPSAVSGLGKGLNSQFDDNELLWSQPGACLWPGRWAAPLKGAATEPAFALRLHGRRGWLGVPVQWWRRGAVVWLGSGVL